MLAACAHLTAEAVRVAVQRTELAAGNGAAGAGATEGSAAEAPAGASSLRVQPFDWTTVDDVTMAPTRPRKRASSSGLAGSLGEAELRQLCERVPPEGVVACLLRCLGEMCELLQSHQRMRDWLRAPWRATPATAPVFGASDDESEDGRAEAEAEAAEATDASEAADAAGSDAKARRVRQRWPLNAAAADALT